MNSEIRDAVRSYNEVGAAVIRNAIPNEWIDRMRMSIDHELANATETSSEYTPSSGSGRYYGDFFVWRHNPDFKAFALDSPAVEIAQQTMQSASVTFFYDHLLVKEAGTAEETPLHQDLPYWPLRGEQIVTVWVPFDEVTADSGAVHYLKGSHRWQQMYAPKAFSEDSDYANTYSTTRLESINSVEQALDDYKQVAWNTQPGDVVLHHPLTLHWAPGNHSPNARRRAIALRYVGDDARYDERPGTFLRSPKLQKALPPISLRDGDRLSGPLFPTIVG